MLLFRSMILGLLGSCVLLLATIAMQRTYPRLAVAHVHDRSVVYRPAPPTATLVDVAPGVAPDQLGSLVRLGPGEQVLAVDDHPVAGDLGAGAALASLAPHGPGFVDLTIAGAHWQRRVVLLLH